MKSLLTKISSSLIIFSLVTSNLFLALPEKAEAQGAASCTAGYLAAGVAALLAVPQNIIGVPKSQAGDTAQNVVTSGSANSLSFNNCILKPLGQMMVISLIRNIGASIVDWVNSGFQGKPSFITDFGGTLLNAADQAIGKFIEGTELGFLCNDFSFQIRIALALKYSKPYREEVRCTLSGIGDNVNNFVENNGGAGWNNWLQLTTEPNNNAYGAYLIADSELAARALSATNLQDKKITIGQGFLDFETCDEYETPSEAQTRYLEETKSLNTSSNTFDSGGGFNTDISSFDSTGFDSGSEVNLNSDTFDTSGVNLPSSNPSPTFDSTFSSSATPQCKPGKMTSKTPGRVIAGKLDSVLGQGEIQAAVADEIDEVIAATLNQLATMAIQGAGGLLGVSKNRSSSGSSYINRYRAQYYSGNSGSTSGSQTTEDVFTVDVGASSALDDYRVSNYDEARAIINNPEDTGLNNIRTESENAVDEGVDSQKQQIDSISNKANLNSQQELNIALLEKTSQSSGDNGSNAVDGINKTSNLIKGTATSNKQTTNPWWEVDLGKDQRVDEVRIWKVNDKDARYTLGTFRVSVKKDGSNSTWTSSSINSATTGNPTKVNVAQTGRYVRIEKNALSYSCGNARFPETCYRPLELAEVKVIQYITAPTSTTPTTSTGDTETEESNDSGSVTIQTPSGSQRAVTGANASFTFGVTSPGRTTIPSVEVRITSNGAPANFSNAFLNTDLGINNSGKTSIIPISTLPAIRLTNFTAEKSNTSLTVSGVVRGGQKGARYEITVTAQDAEGDPISTGTFDFVVE